MIRPPLSLAQRRKLSDLILRALSTARETMMTYRGPNAYLDHDAAFRALMTELDTLTDFSQTESEAKP